MSTKCDLQTFRDDELIACIRNHTNTHIPIPTPHAFAASKTRILLESRVFSGRNIGMVVCEKCINPWDGKLLDLVCRFTPTLVWSFLPMFATLLLKRTVSIAQPNHFPMVSSLYLCKHV